MKAIIIQDHDAANLLDLLKLEKFKDATDHVEFRGRLVALTDDEKKWIIDAIHRRFHYVVTRWLQEQGADVTR